MITYRERIKRYRQVLALRKRGYALAAIGSKMNLSRSRINQIERKIPTSDIHISQKRNPAFIGFRKMGGRERTRHLVRYRDKYTCQDCRAVRTPKMAKRLGKRMFDVHHTHGLCGKLSRSYDKVSTLHTMITLCHKCHFNRPEHKVQSMSFAESLRKIPTKNIAKMKEMRTRGLSLRKIGEKYAVSGQCVMQTLNRYAHK